MCTAKPSKKPSQTLLTGVHIDLVAARIDAASAPTAASRIANDLYARGLFTRPIGTTIQLVPPLIATQDELQALVERSTPPHDELP